MEALITYHEVQAGAHYMRVMVDNQETRLTLYPDGRVNVCVLNAMAKVYRMAAGRYFNSVEEAMAAYKTERTRTAIACAEAVAHDMDRITN
jgi:hypothetical protein